jgi:choline dehydrogenase-like flavoprotein
MSDIENTYDFIIVGAGTAGSVLAARLSEDHSTKVLVLEAGAAAPLPASAIPPAWPTLMQTESNWGDTTSVQSATGLAMPFARGRGIGGSSSINAMVFARGHRDSYAGWGPNGGVGWSYDDLLPYFKRTETANAPGSRPAGHDGPMVVAPACPPNPVLVACLDAAVEAGFRRATDISGGEEIGFGFTDLNIVDGRRQSAADAYLAPALARSNLVFKAQALVQRLLIEKECVGVKYSHAGQTTVAFAAGEVVLAAGAIGSPQLLMVSGVGPQAPPRRGDWGRRGPARGRRQFAGPSDLSGGVSRCQACPGGTQQSRRALRPDLHQVGQQGPRPTNFRGGLGHGARAERGTARIRARRVGLAACQPRHSAAGRADCVHTPHH